MYYIKMRLKTLLTLFVFISIVSYGQQSLEAAKNDTLALDTDISEGSVQWQISLIMKYG